MRRLTLPHLSLPILPLVIGLALGACTEQPKPNATPGLPSQADLNCNGRNAWIPDLRDQAKDAAREIVAHAQAEGVTLTEAQEEALIDEARDVIMWRMVRTQLIGANFNNLGIVPLEGVRTADGRPVTLYRTGLTPDPLGEDSCIQSLIESGGVRHIVNLYHGAIPSRDLIAAESQAITETGGTYFDVGVAGEELSAWRDRLRDDPETTNDVATVVADLINQQILRPGGEAPRGNLHLHCGGGMHRTGMVVGILERCLNQTERQDIVESYRHHVAWRSDDEPGGYEQGNVDFIFDFDCDLLDF